MKTWRVIGVLKWGLAGAALGCAPGVLGLLAYRPTGHDWGPVLLILSLMVLGPAGAVAGLVYGAIRVTGRISPALWFVLPAVAGALAGCILDVEPYDGIGRALFGDAEVAVLVAAPVLASAAGIAGLSLYFRRHPATSGDAKDP